jgi:site-specific recombinase XerD
MVSENGPKDRQDRKDAVPSAYAHAQAFAGFKLANDGHDTRSLARYLGHQNLQSTARYTALAPNRFKDFWKY